MSCSVQTLTGTENVMSTEQQYAMLLPRLVTRLCMQQATSQSQAAILLAHAGDRMKIWIDAHRQLEIHL